MLGGQLLLMIAELGIQNNVKTVKGRPRRTLKEYN